MNLFCWRSRGTCYESPPSETSRCKSGRRRQRWPALPAPQAAESRPVTLTALVWNSCAKKTVKMWRKEANQIWSKYEGPLKSKNVILGNHKFRKNNLQISSKAIHIWKTQAIQTKSSNQNSRHSPENSNNCITKTLQTTAKWPQKNHGMWTWFTWAYYRVNNKWLFAIGDTHKIRPQRHSLCKINIIR